ncbi:hypothetical protein [Sulfurimonas sp.]|uniref:hypothetical protein n=1 Tax=Sulfurimonas sp. TaxID=2022749 RepID=UPI0025F2C4B7|nr:hypothetical protein [Sulfurimonas sp.]MBW6488860.1 hypothetical protein [Sulfurimonas sp.]
MNPTKRSNFDEAVIYTQILNPKTLLVVDAFTTIRYLNIENLSVKEEQKMAILHPRYSTKVISFSEDGKYFASISQDAKESRLYDTQSKKIVATVERHQGDVSCVGIDPKNRYMFSCGDDGMIFGVDIETAQLAFTLPRHVDSINDIAFSSDGKFVATASYDKNISLYNLSMMVPKGKLKAHSAPVLKLQFLNNNRLFSIDKNSGAIVWDLNSSKVICRLKGIHDDITEIAVGYDGALLFLGTKLGYILVYDLSSYEMISRRYVKLESSITALNFDEERDELIVGADNGDLYFYYIFNNEKHFVELLKEKKYAEMLQCIEENPLLKYTKASKIFDTIWEKTVQRAKKLLENSDKTAVLNLFESFNDIPAKRQFAQKLIQEYGEYDKFLFFVKNRKNALAYALANVHPVYKETKIYKAMETEWRNAFSLAKKYLLDEKLGYKAQEILMPYRGISEKTVLIQELVLNVHVYKRFRTAVAQKEFKLSFELAKQNPFLKEYPEHKALIKYSDSLYMKAQTLLGNGDTHSAVKIFRVLLDFDDFKDEAKEIISDIENRHKFFNAVEAEDMILSYNLLESSLSLKETSEGQKLQKQWERDLAKAKEYASSCDVDGIKASLESYMKIKSKNMDMASVLSQCYINELSCAIKDNKEQKSLENGIKNYLLYYGLDEKIGEIFTIFQAQYPETKLNIESQTQGSMNGWRPSMIVNSILE